MFLQKMIDTPTFLLDFLTGVLLLGSIVAFHSSFCGLFLPGLDFYRYIPRFIQLFKENYRIAIIYVGVQGVHLLLATASVVLRGTVNENMTGLDVSFVCITPLIVLILYMFVFIVTLSDASTRNSFLAMKEAFLDALWACSANTFALIVGGFSGYFILDSLAGLN